MTAFGKARLKNIPNNTYQSFLLHFRFYSYLRTLTFGRQDQQHLSLSLHYTKMLWQLNA